MKRRIERNGKGSNQYGIKPRSVRRISSPSAAEKIELAVEMESAERSRSQVITARNEARLTPSFIKSSAERQNSDVAVIPWENTITDRECDQTYLAVDSTQVHEDTSADEKWEIAEGPFSSLDDALTHRTNETESLSR